MDAGGGGDVETSLGQSPVGELRFLILLTNPRAPVPIVMSSAEVPGSSINCLRAAILSAWGTVPSMRTWEMPFALQMVDARSMVFFQQDRTRLFGLCESVLRLSYHELKTIPFLFPLRLLKILNETINL